MKKILVIMIGALTLVCTLNACALPNPGKIQVISSPEPAPSASEASPVPSDEGGEPLTDDEIGELIEEGVVPQDAVNSETGDAVYDEKKAQASIEEYREKIECASKIIAGNNMIVQLKNMNEVTIPKVTVALSSSEDKRELVFYQVGAGRGISIPIEKKPNELPPAVDAKVSVSMAANKYTDITDKINVSIEQKEAGALLTVQNGSDQACALLNITVKFANGTDVVYAQMQEAQAPIEPGASAVLTFSLPKEFEEEGITFDRIEYALNQAVA